MEQTKYDVFISYSRKDYMDEQKNVISGNEVSKIKDALTKAGISYWFDEEGIYSGQNFVEKIVTNIENAKVFLFLSTANANKSPWTCKEIASADEFKKHIIPVRIDPTPYNKKVLFRIADLDYIEYYTNPQKGMEDMIKSIKAYMEELANIERRKIDEEKKKKEQKRKREEELKRQKEQDEKRRQEEQQQLVAEIRLSCTTLNNEEAKLELDRSTLLLKTEKVADNEQRASLIDMISKGGEIHKKFQEKCSELTQEIENLKSTDESLIFEIRDKEEQISQLESNLNAAKSQKEQNEKRSSQLIEQNSDLQKQIKILQDKADDRENKNKKLRRSIWVHVAYWIVLIIAVIWLTNTYNECEYWKSRYDYAWEELQKSNKDKKTLSLLSNHIPFIITDIEIKNDGEDWGDKIYSCKSTYFRPRIKYIGINHGTYKLDIKIFDSIGELSHNEATSPKEYSYSDELSIVKGENISGQISGWGNEKPGNWPPGIYRIEIWYKERKMSEKSFRVY